ncbi:immunity 22 family protein [Acinetobacter sp. IK40]|jgi:Immunity protein 22|uniref:immunity 22 family protein n=1 Tax=Acinetobacter sp. IK40 TaxID=2928897 RepID=UPI002D1F2089|nr:immunity 22 family protein [Acinetobacter sp. IK40]MEB3790215.1 immunity 22 family protein [Acinetobacter sp. IK40]
MQKNDYVSIWGGVLDSHDSLNSYTFNDYSLDGEFVGSIFSKEFEIDFVDDDFIEKDFHNLTSNFEIILEGFSYSDKIKEEITLKGSRLPFPINSIILIYNFSYELDKTTENFTFLCAVPYK